jgi:thiol-disulfide isomerase/thioredoxin
MRTLLNMKTGLISAAALALALASATSIRADVEVPRYKFAVGQELDYAGRSNAQHQDHPQVDLTDTAVKIWVVRENPDHSFHMIVMSNTRNGAPGKDGKPQPPVTTIAPLDLNTNGDVPEGPSTAGQSTPAVFPPLPHDVAAMAGWENADDQAGTRTLFKALRQRDRNEFYFEGVQTSVTDPIYLTASSATFHFDWNKGLISHIETQFSQGFGLNVRGTGGVELQQVVTADENFIKQLANESDILFAASAAAGKASETALLDPTQTDAKLAEAAAALKDAESKITLPMLKDQLEDQIKGLPDAAKAIHEDAKHRADLLAAPPLTWTTTDFAGPTVTAEALHGKVLILNFWSRGIPWCISQIPALKTIQADYKDAPVLVLGLNTDDAAPDAQAVAQALQITYPQLKGAALANQLKINVLPTTLVIDQSGKIRDIYSGFSPNLHEAVGKTVKDLLGQK